MSTAVLSGAASGDAPMPDAAATTIGVGYPRDGTRAAPMMVVGEDADPTSWMVPPDAASYNERRRTKILLLGLRRSGKTSIVKAVFEGMPPKETLYLEHTLVLSKHLFHSVMPFELWDCPTEVNGDLTQLGVVYSHISTLIFVIDIRDALNDAVVKLTREVIAAYRQKPSINFEVFVHKAEDLAEDYKNDLYRNVEQLVRDELEDEAPEYEKINVNFHLTSIFDTSILLAFSRVVQRPVPALPFIEDLLNAFCLNSNATKAFLLDTTSGLYLATDESPVDSATFDLCCAQRRTLGALAVLYRTPARPARDSLRTMHAAPSHAPRAAHHPYPSGSASFGGGGGGAGAGRTVLHRAVGFNLALVAVLPSDVYAARRGLVESNVVFCRQGVQEICAELDRDARAAR